MTRTERIIRQKRVDSTKDPKDGHRTGENMEMDINRPKKKDNATIERRCESALERE